MRASTKRMVHVMQSWVDFMGPARLRWLNKRTKPLRLPELNQSIVAYAGRPIKRDRCRRQGGRLSRVMGARSPAIVAMLTEWTKREVEAHGRLFTVFSHPQFRRHSRILSTMREWQYRGGRRSAN